MTYFEKIKAMDVDELAEFLDRVRRFDGFMTLLCTGLDYKAAVKFLLEQEVGNELSQSDEGAVEFKGGVVPRR